MTKASVKLLGPNGESQVPLIVDVGSPFTWIDQKELTAAGIVPSGFRTFKTRKGASLARQVGEALIEVLSSRATTQVVFAQPHDTQVLGQAAVLQLALVVDEVKGQLRKAEVLPSYQLETEAEAIANPA